MTALAQTVQNGAVPPKPCVLFVDDEEAILTTMRIMFRRQFNVLTAGGGEQALQILREQDVHVIVSDQRMPGMEGVEVLRWAREIRPRAMRVLLTGYSDLSAIIGSINEGEIYRYVHKPWSNEVLQSIISQAAESAMNIADAQAALLIEGDQAGENAANAELPADTRTGVLVLDSDRVSVEEVQRLLGGSYPVHHATSIQGGLDLLDRHSIGVLVVETTIGSDSVTTLLNLLKQHHPQVVSIVLTHRSDAHAAVELINQGQIFRFLLKPVREGMCVRSVHQAMQRHETLARNPVLAARYRVQEAPVPAAAAQGGLFDRIRQLRGLFGTAR